VRRTPVTLGKAAAAENRLTARAQDTQKHVRRASKCQSISPLRKSAFKLTTQLAKVALGCSAARGEDGDLAMDVCFQFIPAPTDSTDKGRARRKPAEMALDEFFQQPFIVGGADGFSGVASDEPAREQDRELPNAGFEEKAILPVDGDKRCCAGSKRVRIEAA
jgi:hypothetical protein